MTAPTADHDPIAAALLAQLNAALNQLHANSQRYDTPLPPQLAGRALDVDRIQYDTVSSAPNGAYGG